MQGAGSTKKSHKPQFTERPKIDRLHVHCGDDITWEYNGNEFEIWFPPGRNPLVGPNQSGRVKKFTAIVKPDLKSQDVYQYCIFSYADDSMVEGNSPPEMIIE